MIATLHHFRQIIEQGLEDSVEFEGDVKIYVKNRGSSDKETIYLGPGKNIWVLVNTKNEGTRRYTLFNSKNLFNLAFRDGEMISGLKGDRHFVEFPVGLTPNTYVEIIYKDASY